MDHSGRADSSPRTKARPGYELSIAFSLALMLAIAGCSWGSGSNTAADHGVCVKDLDELTQLLVQPQSCSATEECPDGSFCSPSTGTCDWACFADSDCGAGGHCNCQGQCDEAGPDAGVTEDPSCPRDEARLTGLESEPERCVFNDECPYGSRCDAESGTCVWDCLSTEHPDPMKGCTGGAVCDCLGACVEPGAELQRSSEPRPALEIFPTDIPVTSEQFEPRRIGVHLVTEDQGVATDAATASVTVTAPTGTEVSCDATSQTGGTYGATCVLNDWTAFSSEVGVLRARNEVWVKPTIDIDPADGGWLFRFSSGRIANGSRTAEVRLVGQEPPPVFTEQGEYRGVLTRTGIQANAILSSFPTLADETPRQTPVRAWVTGDIIDFYDETRSITDSGWLRIQTGQELSALLLEPIVYGNDLPDVSALVRVLTDAAPSRVFDASSGMLTGSFALDTAYFASSWSFSLASAGALSTCAGSSECAGGETCDLSLGSGVCVPSPGWSAGPSDWGDFLSLKAQRWVEAVEDLIPRVLKDPAGSTGFPELWQDIYHPQMGVSRLEADSGRAIVGAHLLDDATLPVSFGFELSQQFRDLVDQWDPTDPAPQSPQWVDLATGPGDDFYDHTSGGTSIPATAKTSMVPCYRETPYQQEHGSYQRPTSHLGHCKAMYENRIWLNEPGSAPSPPTSFENYLQSECIETNDTITYFAVVVGSVRVDYRRVHLCPVMPPLLGTTDDIGASRRLAERLLCYDPSLPQGNLLSSAALGSEILDFSGDLRCANGTIPGAVGLAVQADRGAEGESSLVSGDMVRACLDDLALEPPELSTGLNATNGQSQLETLFAANSCFRPANFYTALELAKEGIFSSTGGVEAQRLMMRLAQQWTELHSFVMREGLSVERMAKHLRFRKDLGLAEEDALASAPGYEALLEQQERGWNLLRQMLILVIQTEKDALLEPDYRGPVPENPNHDQKAGLLVAVAEGLARHMDLTAAYLDDTLETTYGRCYRGTGDPDVRAALQRGARALRYAQVLSSDYLGLYAFAIDGAAAGWQPRWHQAWTEFASSRSRAMTALRKLQDCEPPPLLASEQAYPIFFGDPVGTSAKYFASSDYLLNGWAIPAVQSAASALEQARTAFISKRNSDIQTKLAEDDAARRLDEIKASYGRPLINYCGLSEIEARDALDVVGIDSGAINLGNCHFDTSNPSCSADGVSTPAAEAYAAMTDDEIQFELCIANRIAESPGVLASTDAETQGSTYIRFIQFLEHFAPAIAETTYPNALSNGDGTFTAGGTTDWATYSLFELASAMHVLVTIAGEDAEDALEAAKASCVDSGTAAASGETPVKTTSLTLSPELDRQPAAECYRGSMGEATLGVITSGNVIASAEAEMTTLEEQYQLAFRGCVDFSDTSNEIQELEDAHLAHMKELRRALTMARIEIDERAARRSMFSLDFVSAGAGLFAEYLDSEADKYPRSYSRAELRRLEEQMANEEAKHALVVQKIQNALAVRQCFRQADSLRAGFRSAMARIVTALGQQDQAMLALNNARRAAAQTILEGRAAVAREEGRLIPSYAHHYWLSEKIDRFEKDFDWSKKLTFLALRAVEYEFQQSLALREDILSATDPDQLLDAINLLQQEQLTRTINSRRPEQSKLVLSLRDQLQRIAHKIELVSGDRDWSPERIFRERLWSAEYAVFDDTGAYMGQGIPFTVEPVGPLELRCGERLWRMSATVQGDILDVDEPATSIFVIRPNSFASQWCAGHGDGRELQIGSLQPTSGLFKDGSRGGSEAYGPEHITSMLEPWFNVPRSEFYREEYAEGASEEFAGRGLYGDYILVFPWKGLLEHGFPLEQVEDVLIRFDYLSVDNATNL